jgi:hypothetical protein
VKNRFLPAVWQVSCLEVLRQNEVAGGGSEPLITRDEQLFVQDSQEILSIIPLRPFVICCMCYKVNSRGLHGQSHTLGNLSFVMIILVSAIIYTKGSSSR